MYLHVERHCSISSVNHEMFRSCKVHEVSGQEQRYGWFITDTLNWDTLLLLLLQLLHDKLLMLLLMPLQVDVIIGRWQIHRVTVNTSIQRFEPLNIHWWLLSLYVSVLPAMIENIVFHQSVVLRNIQLLENNVSLLCLVTLTTYQRQLTRSRSPVLTMNGQYKEPGHIFDPVCLTDRNPCTNCHKIWHSLLKLAPISKPNLT